MYSCRGLVVFICVRRFTGIHRGNHFRESPDSSSMITGLIVSLSVFILYLAVRWKDSRTEITRLKIQVASLKRQLVTHGRAR